MSATCQHADADAYLHADCHGCVMLMLQRAEADEPRRAAERAAWRASSTSEDVIADVQRGMAQESRHVERARLYAGPDGLELASLLRDATQNLTNATRMMPEFRATIQDVLRAQRAADITQSPGYASQYNQRPATIIDGDYQFAPVTPMPGLGEVIDYFQRRLASASALPTSIFPAPQLPPPPLLLPDRPLTPEERAAHDSDPRPGVWAGESGADLRKLTQEETDTLIRHELWMSLPLNAPEAERRELTAIVGSLRYIQLTRPRQPHDGPGPEPWVMTAVYQRGGIDSDPLVRLLAYRAWGDRDRQWFGLRGVRAGEPVVAAEIVQTESGGGAPVVALRWARDLPSGIALEDGGPGDLVKCRIDAGSLGGLPIGRWTTSAAAGGVAEVEIFSMRMPVAMHGVMTMLCRASDRLRADPARPRALTTAEAQRWATTRIDAAHGHFLRQGVPDEQLWTEVSVDPGAAVLWHAPGGHGASVEERQVLARTWVADGELQYEGPEVAAEVRDLRTADRDALAYGAAIRGLGATFGPDAPIRWDTAPRVSESDIRDLQAMADRHVEEQRAFGSAGVFYATMGDTYGHAAGVLNGDIELEFPFAQDGDLVVGAHGYRPGDRARSSTGAEYVVTAVDANRFTLSSPRPAPAPPAGGMRSPAAKPQPPVPRWARKKRTRATARGGR